MTTTIIGAGPVGCYTAWRLAKKGIAVNVVEEHSKVGLPFQCAGLVSDNLKKVINFPDKLVLNRIHGAKFFFPDSEPLHFKGNAFVLDRIGLDQFIYEEAVLSGVKFYFNERYERFDDYSFEVRTDKRKIEYEMLVGADGPLSAVGKQMGVVNDHLVGMQARVKGEFDDTVELHFGSKYPGFFAWVVPEDSKVARVGVAAKEGVAEILKGFLKEKKIREGINQQGGVIPVDYHGNFVSDRLALVGDAAAQTKATTGGGLTTGLDSAKFLVKAISRGYKSNDLSAKFLHKEYVKKWKRGIGKELRKAYLIRKSLDLFSDEDYSDFRKIISDERFKKDLEENVDMETYSKFIKKSLLHPEVFGFLLKMGMKNPSILKNAFKVLL